MNGPVFISHASEDLEAAKHVASILKNELGVEAWYAHAEIRAGQGFRVGGQRLLERRAVDCPSA